MKRCLCHPILNTPLTRVMKILMALYWHWAWCSQPMLFYDGLSPIAEPLRLPSVPPAYPSDCFPPGPRDCVAPVPCSYPTPAPPLQCRDIKAVCSSADIAPPPVPTHGLCVPAAVNRPRLPPTLGWELKKITKSSTRPIQAENSNQMQRMKGIKLNGPSIQNS